MCSVDLNGHSRILSEMNDTVINIEGLGKQYTIQHDDAFKPTTLREEIFHQGNRFFSKLKFGKAKKSIKEVSEERIWVLDDVSFKVSRGEVVGIIGRNGAGKSTLLKILSRITDPSSGKVTLSGRVASLLEVGTGFHSELTGRENIYLNGTILGMTKSEIGAKFDEIVAFSGVEKFLDTPVKRYSSGMYVRLAFAVASHLDPDILIIDEVLAVGDMDFQRKCLGRMEEVSKQGRTVLFVSHNLPMVSSLCSQCVLLDGGKLITKGATADVLPLYHGGSFVKNSKPVSSVVQNSLKRIDLMAAWVTDQDGIRVNNVSLFDDIYLNIEYSVEVGLCDLVVPFFHVFDEKGEYVFLTFPYDWPENSSQEAGRYIATCHIPAHFLNDGTFSASIQVNTVKNGHVLEFFEHHALRFVVQDNILENVYRAHVKYSYELPGVVRPLLNWQLKKVK